MGVEWGNGPQESRKQPIESVERLGRFAFKQDIQETDQLSTASDDQADGELTTRQTLDAMSTATKQGLSIRGLFDKILK
jgi:hypothetical protein